MIGLDWIAAAGTFVSAELVTRKKWQGFAVHAANGLLWAFFMWRARLWGLLAHCKIVFVAQGLLAIRRWRYAMSGGPS